MKYTLTMGSSSGYTLHNPVSPFPLHVPGQSLITIQEQQRQDLLLPHPPQQSFDSRWLHCPVLGYRERVSLVVSPPIPAVDQAFTSQSGDTSDRQASIFSALLAERGGKEWLTSLQHCQSACCQASVFYKTLAPE